jgi:glycosyltransferase involved in cell wall biosynthesis
MIKVSFIIPVYNGEAFIERCVQSVVDQDLGLHECEIVIVNDGSTDNTPGILERLQRKWNNIRIITTENMGAGSARNTGLRSSEGHIISFVDADDYLEPRIFQSLIEKFSDNGLDILGFETRSVRGKRTIITKSLEDGYGVVFKGNDFFINYKDGFGPCAKLVRRGLFLEHDLFFPEGIIPEDIELVPKLYLTADKIMFVNLVGYNYVFNPLSVTKVGSQSTINSRIKGLVTVALSLNEFSKKFVNTNRQVYESLFEKVINKVIDELFYFIEFRYHLNQKLLNQIFLQLVSAELLPVKAERRSGSSIRLYNYPSLFRIVYLFRLKLLYYRMSRQMIRLVRWIYRKNEIR